MRPSDQLVCYEPIEFQLGAKQCVKSRADQQGQSSAFDKRMSVNRDQAIARQSSGSTSASQAKRKLGLKGVSEAKRLNEWRDMNWGRVVVESIG